METHPRSYGWCGLGLGWNPGGLAPEPICLGFHSSSPSNRLSHLPISDVLSVKHDKLVLIVPKVTYSFI